mmetsp:Transcript_27620/g.36242  ORF Transcript_27620/g.36242 Transcript_27620/m.36242 type:complete len:258 (+) Transcript_27620:362-1135(+)
MQYDYQLNKYFVILVQTPSFFFGLINISSSSSSRNWRFLLRMSAAPFSFGGQLSCTPVPPLSNLKFSLDAIWLSSRQTPSMMLGVKRMPFRQRAFSACKRVSYRMKSQFPCPECCSCTRPHAWRSAKAAFSVALLNPKATTQRPHLSCSKAVMAKFRCAVPPFFNAVLSCFSFTEGTLWAKGPLELPAGGAVGASRGFGRLAKLSGAPAVWESDPPSNNDRVGGASSSSSTLLLPGLSLLCGYRRCRRPKFDGAPNW